MEYEMNEVRYDDTDEDVYDDATLQNSQISQEHVTQASAKGKFRNIIYICIVVVVITALASAVTGYYVRDVFMTKEQFSWTSWSHWTSCTSQHKNRTRVIPVCHDNKCNYKEDYETRECEERGQFSWSSWSHWTSCTSQQQNRTRMISVCHDTLCDYKEDGETRKCDESGNVSGQPLSCLKDCKAWYDSGIHDDGVYCIKPDWTSTPAFDVYCDMTTDDGGWLVFQRRVDGSQDFFLGWDCYTHGFGSLTGEFWLGNKYIHILTKEPSELRVDLLAWDNTTAFAKFSNFEISDEESKFMLTISGYSGTAGDSLDYHNGHNFSTKDQDNSRSSGKCAKENQGAWWYNFCSHSSLNGKYYIDNATDMHTHNHGINWEKFKGDRYSLKGSSMMLRRK